MKELFLLKLGEIVLKGQNRRTFEDKLKANTRRRMAVFGDFKVTITQSTLYVEPKNDDCDLDGAWEACGTIFGVAQMCRCRACEKDLDAIFKTVVEYLGDELAVQKSFKVESKRSDKRFPLNSIQISQDIGGRIAEEFPQVAVDVHNPSYVVNVEVRETAAYVHGPSVPGAGGLPTGTGGRAAVLLSGGIDSPVAGYMIAKRGVKIDAVYFHAPPYTSDRAKQKVVDLARQVSRYSGPIYLHTINFTDIQLYIYEKCPHEELTIIMRRYMMKIAEIIAKENECLGLITGESIGQVASQTVQSLAVTNEVCTLPVFRPLIGFDKMEIVDISEKIGTYETSILPYEDCCTIFVAKHPVTKPNLNIIKRHEENLKEKIDELVQQALDSDVVEIVKVD